MKSLRCYQSAEQIIAIEKQYRWLSARLGNFDRRVDSVEVIYSRSRLNFFLEIFCRISNRLINCESNRIRFLSIRANFHENTFDSLSLSSFVAILPIHSIPFVSSNVWRIITLARLRKSLGMFEREIYPGNENAKK